MKKYFYISLILIFSIISCTYGPIPIYQDSPVLKINSYPLSLDFHVPDVDSNGWNSYQWGDVGEDTINTQFSLSVDNDQTIYIYSINYDVYSNNEYIYNDDYVYPVPVEINTEDTVLLNDLDIIMTEYYAYDIDDADDTLDMKGEGIIEFRITFYNNAGDYYTSVPVRASFSLSE